MVVFFFLYNVGMNFVGFCIRSVRQKLAYKKRVCFMLCVIGEDVWYDCCELHNMFMYTCNTFCGCKCGCVVLSVPSQRVVCCVVGFFCTICSNYMLLIIMYSINWNSICIYYRVIDKRFMGCWIGVCYIMIYETSPRERERESECGGMLWFGAIYDDDAAAKIVRYWMDRGERDL